MEAPGTRLDPLVTRRIRQADYSPKTATAEDQAMGEGMLILLGDPRRAPKGGPPALAARRCDRPAPLVGGRPRAATAAGAEGVDFVTCRLCGRRLGILTPGHLRKAHGLGRGAIADYARKFRVRRFRSLRTIRAQRRSLVAGYLRAGKRWTRSRAVEEVRKFARGGAPLSASLAAVRDPLLFGRASRAFGSWERALRASGVDPAGARRHRRWSRASVLRAIRSLAPGGLNHKAAEDRDPALVQAARRLFGGWDDAVRAAGMDPARTRLRRAWDPDLVLREIRRLVHGTSRAEVLRNDPSLVGIAVFYFGNWRTAAGLAKAYAAHGESAASREKVVRSLRRAVRGGRSLAWKVFYRERPDLFRAALRAFGSWRGATRAAGFRLNRPMTRQEWTRPELVGLLARLSRSGRKVSGALLRRLTPKGYSAPGFAIRRSFGSIGSALCELGGRRVGPGTQPRAARPRRTFKGRRS